MQKLAIYLILPFLFFASSCSKEDKVCVVDTGEQYDEYGIYKWDDPEDFNMIRYYTLLDVMEVKSPNLSVLIRAEESVTTEVAWNIAGAPYESSFTENPLIENIYLREYKPILMGHEFMHGEWVRAEITINDKTVVNRSAMITETMRERDLLTVNFGMNMEEVRANIFEGGLTEFGDMALVQTGVWHFEKGAGTVYFFEETAIWPTLTWVGEYVEPANMYGQTESNTSGTSFVDHCHSLGFEGEIEFNPDGTLKTEYEWQDRYFTFRIEGRNDLFQTSPEEGSEEITDPSTDPIPTYVIGITYSLREF